MRVTQHVGRPRPSEKTTAPSRTGRPEHTGTAPDDTNAAIRRLRARAGAILRLDAARQRPTAALALALLSDATPEAARTSLATLPPEATRRAFTLPEAESDPPELAAEKRRIAAIVCAPEAGGRTDQAAYLAIETGMAADAAIALLATMPRPELIPTIAERAASEEGFGPSGRDMSDRAGGDVWAAVIDRLNAKTAGDHVAPSAPPQKPGTRRT